MSVSSILSSNFASSNPTSIQSQWRQYKAEFNQLGQDLQSGNLSAAQSDFATLQQEAPQGAAINSTQSTSPIAQEYKQLSQDLQSGNLSGAQQDYSNLRQDYQTQAGWHHHHFRGGGGGVQDPVLQQLLQSGTTAQSSELSLSA